MKTVTHLSIVTLFSILASGCDVNSDGTIDNENTIIGKWKLTEAFISSGGPQYWTTVEDGEEIEFFAGGNFVSNRFPECITGDFSVESNELLLDYNCDGFEVLSENEEGSISYHLEFDSNYFIATPTSGPICIEGCSYKYIRE